MQVLDNLAFWQWFVQVCVVIFIIGGIAGIAVGAGLIVNSSGTFSLFEKVNRWTSLRRVTKPLEIPRDTTGIVHKYMRVLATVFVIGGAYSLYALIFQFNADAILFGLKLTGENALVTGLMLDFFRWPLVAGNVAAIIVGLVMFFAPDQLRAVEARGSKWFSDRVIRQTGDRMHMPLDRWVSASPRVAGITIAIGSGIVVISAALMLASA